MGAGIRPKGAFQYAALRYTECRNEVPCFKDKSKCPDKELCERCAHRGDCV